VHTVLLLSLGRPRPPSGLVQNPPPTGRAPSFDPRSVLREFGLEIGEDVEIRIWDSTSEVRYLVLPERPAGTEHLTERTTSRSW